MPTSTGSTSTPVPAAPYAGRRSLHLAWTCVALIPVAFIVASVLGDWLLSLQNYDAGGTVTPPIDVLLLAGAPAVLVMIAPGIAAAWLGLRARRLGMPIGIVPAVLGIAAVAFGVLTNTLPLLLSGS